ncbi:MAG: dihydropteroate synthase [Gammaproteobacteria bacterium]|nr:dihydropteroate synthase [Gammaproteobacteria bacterium]
MATATPALNCRGKLLPLTPPCVMGILNITPDSFSDGGNFLSVSAAVQRARTMAGEGAAIIDVGGESTRPGATPVSVQEELDRVLPVIEAIRAELPVVISIDTSKPEVMRAAVEAGASFINDVFALRAEGALQAAVEINRRYSVLVCLMHMQGMPRTMQQQPHYDDVVGEVRNFLGERAQQCVTAGIPRERLLIDPGFGFGKSLAHNLTLLKHLDMFAGMNLPLLVGLSRKSMIGALLGNEVGERLYGSIALATIAVLKGALLVRTHDVRATVDAVKMAAAVQQAGQHGK